MATFLGVNGKLFLGSGGLALFLAISCGTEFVAGPVIYVEQPAVVEPFVELDAAFLRAPDAAFPPAPDLHVYPFGKRPPEACDPHAGASPRFSDETAAWGLSAALGTRIVAGDLDGDGFADLVMNRGNLSVRETVGASRIVHVWMNRPSPSGVGRVFVDQTYASRLFQRRGGDSVFSTTGRLDYLRGTQLTVLADVDNDGDLDVFSGAANDPDSASTDVGDRSELMLNDGHGQFRVAGETNLFEPKTQRLHTSGASFLDANRDGKIDLFTGYFYARNSESGSQVQLYQGDGRSGFSAVTQAVGLMAARTSTAFEDGTNSRPAYGVTACDLNDDGASDMIVSSYGRQSNQLWLNDGAGAFRDIGASSGVGADGNISYADNENFKCYCTVHATEANCAGVEQPRIQCGQPADRGWRVGADDQAWRAGGNNFSSVCADFNGDGLMDVYHASIRHWWAGLGADASAMLINKGGAVPTFDRLDPAAHGLAFSHKREDWDEGALMAAAGDFNNDARQDLLVGLSDYPDNRANLFQQNQDGNYTEMAEALGLKHPCAAGMTVVDLDNDGDLDVLLGASRMRNCAQVWPAEQVRVYINHAADDAASRSLTLRLVGDGITTNASAIGAKVTVKVGGATMVREVGGGYGHRGMQNGLQVHVGLGNCKFVDELRVDWPDATRTSVSYGSLPTTGVLNVFRDNQGVERASAP